jgi:hypothetical protein
LKELQSVFSERIQRVTWVIERGGYYYEWLLQFLERVLIGGKR